MAADGPTILATSGGFRRGERSSYAFGPLIDFALELSGASRPRLCYVGTAGGDQRHMAAYVSEAGAAAGVRVDHLPLFPMPPAADLGAFLLDHEVVWVGGGSVANLLALWRLHHLDAALEAAWRAGVVLGGVSAGSICWHLGGTTDSFGPDLVVVDNGLGFLPYSNGVHYDSEAQRRPLFQRLIAEGVLPEGYATEDGVGLLYRGTVLAEAVSELPGKLAYRVHAEYGVAIEEALSTRLLPQAG